MINQEIIEEVKKRLIAVYQPKEIYLFGSYAWGTPQEDSDLDILVVIKAYENDRYNDLVKGHRALAGLKISKDLLLYSQQEFSEAASDVSTLCYKIKKKGKKIYAQA